MFCGDTGPRNFGVEKNQLQCKSCGNGYVVTSAPVMLELKGIDYNVNHVGNKCGDIGPRNFGNEKNPLQRT